MQLCCRVLAWLLQAVPLAGRMPPQRRDVFAVSTWLEAETLASNRTFARKVSI
jgi:hypothetical protein